MPAGPNDVKFYKSTVSGSAGGTRSAVEVTSTKNSLFEDISDSERTAGGTKTKKWFVANVSGTESWALPVIWIDTIPTNCTEVLGVGFNDSEDDDIGQGNMVAWDASATLTAQSDGADTRTITIVGKDGSGNAASEVITLNGVTVVTSAVTYSAVYACRISAVSGTRTVTIKRTGSGTTRGTIGINYKTCWVWLAPTTKANGFKLATLAPGADVGFWDKLTWNAGAGAVDLNSSVIAGEAS
jgi:hypothetical protein